MEYAPIPRETHLHQPKLPPTYLLRRNAKRLGISGDDFDACTTTTTLQILAKTHYRRLVKAHHPDSFRPRKPSAHSEHHDTPLTDDMPRKRCPKCAHVKALIDFAINRSAKDGRQYYCRACMSQCSKTPKTGHAPGSKITRGVMFQYLTEAYKFLLALPKNIRIQHTTSTQTREPLPILEATLPWAMERRAPVLGFGWHETHP